MKRSYIGYWKNKDFPETSIFPTPVANTASPDQVKQMLDVLENFVIPKSSLKVYKGSSICRLCQCNNSSEEFELTKRRKGKIIHIWIIPFGIIHYVRDHKVLIPELLTLQSDYERTNTNQFNVQDSSQRC